MSEESHPRASTHLIGNYATTVFYLSPFQVAPLIAAGSREARKRATPRNRAPIVTKASVAQADTRVLAGGTLGFELPLRMAKRAMHAPLELDVQGVSLTEFAQAICLQEQVEVSLIRLPITVQQVTFPLCLVAASCLRPQVRPRLGGIPAWPPRGSGSMHS